MIIALHEKIVLRILSVSIRRFSTGKKLDGSEPDMIMYL
jgi:hypothetical protein